MFRGQDVSGCDKIYGEKAVELHDAFPESDQIQKEIEELWFKTEKLHLKHAEDLQILDKRKAELQWELKQFEHRSHRLLQLRDAFMKLREKASSSS